MKWITAKDLEDWAQRVAARAGLIEMVGDLIRASVPNASQFRFPGGDKAQVRGFDGDLESDISVEYVPKGESKWEFGVSRGVKKAKDDYDKRTENTPESVRLVNTLVLVNLNTWDSSKSADQIDAWMRARVDEKKWRDVRYIDGAQLEHWLDQHPVVAARYARNVLRLAPQTGAQSIDEFWDSYSARYQPRLTEAVLLAERSEQADRLLEQLGGTPKAFVYGAESAEEVIAFAVAVVRSSPPETRRMLEARVIIVESVEAARFLATKSNLVYLTRGDADAHAGMLGAHGPTLSAAVGVHARRNNVERLILPSATSLGSSIETMGFEREEAYQLARDCGRSLTILRRRIPNGPWPEPGWLAYRDALLPAFLSGGWNSGSKLDKEVLQQLADRKSYDEFERGVRPTLELSDPPIDRVENVWQTRSLIDALPYLADHMGEKEFERFREAALTVLGRPTHVPSAEETFRLGYEAPEDFSAWLRDGLANTMILIATAPRTHRIQPPDQTPQEFIDDIVRKLPHWGKNHRSLRGLRDQLTAIAEAAPLPFVQALEDMLEGDPADMANVFSESEGMFEPTSLHVYILFALELLAWDPQLLPRVALTLARLALLDPGVKLTNRPINSLRSIFLSWAPNTYATVDQRIACIDEIVAAEPAVGWALLASLLPRHHDIGHPTRKPTFRDVTPRNVETLTFGVVWKANTAVIERAIHQAADDEQRLLTLIGGLHTYEPGDRPMVLERLDQYLDTHRTREGSEIWYALRDLVNRHEALAEMDWTLDDEQLAPIRTMVDKYRPQDPIERYTWLFDDWLPAVRAQSGQEVEAVGEARARAVLEILTERGVDGVVRLAARAKLPYLVAEAFSNVDQPVDVLRDLTEQLWAQPPQGRNLAGILSAIALQQHADTWPETLRVLIDTEKRDAAAVARLLVNWPNARTTWQMVSSFGEEVETAYWQSIGTLPRDGSKEDFFEAIARFRKAGRSIDVFGAAFQRLGELPGSLILDLLDESIETINAQPPSERTMLEYHLQHAFKVLGEKDGVTLEDIARREYSYLPLLDSRKSDGLLLHQFMARNPDFYFEVFSDVFRSSDEEPAEPTPTERDRVQVSYDLLSSFVTLPGQTSEGVDRHALLDWISRVRELESASGLGEIGDQYLGRMLAHSDFDPADGLWPRVAVRDVIESLKNEQIERGIAIERYNMRGVHTKAITEGGRQEREIAMLYRKWADGIDGFFRTSSMLNRIADDWDRDAAREDTKAEQEKLKR